MSVTPSIVYMCPDCGAETVYMLVPMETGEPRPAGEAGVLPSLVLSCARCGSSQTYMLTVVNPGT